ARPSQPVDAASGVSSANGRERCERNWSKSTNPGTPSPLPKQAPSSGLHLVWLTKSCAVSRQCAAVLQQVSAVRGLGSRLSAAHRDRAWVGKTDRRPIPAGRGRLWHLLCTSPGAGNAGRCAEIGRRLKMKSHIDEVLDDVTLEVLKSSSEPAMIRTDEV